MDENSDPHGAKKKKGGRDFGVVFVVVSLKKKTVKIEGRKEGVLSEYHQTPINK